ncbi:LPS-assembly protein LptD [Flaviaesturariibacter flavus]|uniref:LPS-assembly protein LptD n=1 Tax=Flaviaesturariibacter flavus TaxID=2502780 RepID=A0A4R1BP38_9BACT|nr:putative LPS assembly protein LptD [Flaviaesturariibacter flavus]TCJ19096.1 LPS-assembly protein LptD [Flaviaesturariibacter flavus]
MSDAFKNTSDTGRRPAADTIPRRDTVPVRDSNRVPRTDTFTLRMSKDSLDGPVNYKAEDSAVVLVPQKKIILYGKTHTTYKDAVLDAPKVEIDNQTNTVVATGEKDSLGETITRARMQETDNKFESDTIRYNFKSQRGLLTNTFTTQNDMFINGRTIKKVDANTVFIKGGRFTTCDLDEPHFAFRANKLKIINNKVAVSGPMHPEFEGVPVPVYLPFGYYPLSKGRHSGLLPPQFVSTQEQGIGLEGLGYYRVLNEYLDATFRANIYSYGGWRGDLSSSYRRRYRYNGGINLSLQNSKFNFKGDPDYTAAKTFNIMWSHSVDQRARPGVNFSASVNAGSTKYNRFVTSSLQRNVQNQLTSSISYAKNWIGKPFALTLSANHSQNSETRVINMTLPDATFSVNTIYPLQRAEQVGAPKWYEKLGVGYNGSFRNNFAFYDSAFSFQRLLDTLSWGAVHSLPVSLTLPPLGPVLVSPGISYQQQWIQRRTLFSWNEQAGKVDTIRENGLFTAHSLAASLGISTSVFGTFQFHGSRLKAIRHTMRPSVSVNYTPNLARNYYREFQSDRNGTKTQYNVFSTGVGTPNLFTGYSNIENGGLGFSLDNSLEMKLRSKDSGAREDRKVRLIDGFGFSGGYNFLLEKYKLTPIALYLRSSLFDKLNLNFTGSLNPYAVDTAGHQVEDYAWKKGFGAGRLTSGSISLSTSFRSKPRDAARKGQQASASNNINDPTLMADQTRLAEYMRLNPNQFVDFNIPYDLSLDLAFNFTRTPLANFRTRTDINSSLNFRSSFSLTPKWNFSSYGYFDLKTMKPTGLSLSINRDMHCWQMSIGLTPVGPQRYFSISIAPKSSILQNLKVNRTRVFTDF